MSSVSNSTILLDMPRQELVLVVVTGLKKRFMQCCMCPIDSRVHGDE